MEKNLANWRLLTLHADKEGALPMNLLKTRSPVTISFLALSTACALAVDDLSIMRGAYYVSSYAKNDVDIWMD